MAEHVGPLALINPLVRFSQDEWSELARISGVRLSDEHQTKLMECTARYIEKAVSHIEGAPRGDVEKVIKKIRNVCKEVADELERLDKLCFRESSRNGYKAERDPAIGEKEEKKRLKQEKEDRAYRVVNRLIGECYWDQFNTLVEFGSRIIFLNDLETLCKLAEVRLDDYNVSDKDLSIYLYQVSVIFSDASGKGPTSQESFDFVHLMCTKVVGQLQRSATPDAGYEAAIFYNFKSMTNKNPEDSRDTIKWRIKERMKAVRLRNATLASGSQSEGFDKRTEFASATRARRSKPTRSGTLPSKRPRR